jgi:GNAT superfamily N-acetyltransferase
MSTSAGKYRVRLASASDASCLAAVERAAAARFEEVGLASIAQGRPTSEAEYRKAISEGRLWVVETGEAPGRVVGLAIAELRDGEGFLAEVSVVPDHAGRRLAARLIEAVEAWAAAQKCVSLSLTTFRDVPWNRPYYERLGFAVLAEKVAGPEVRAVRRRERAHGLDAHGARVCMIRSIRKKTG